MNNLRRRALLSSSGGIDPTTGRGKIGNYEVVDLGLPSGLLWATCNVGANSETEYGDYYMYGMGSRTYNQSDNLYTGMEDPLASSADTATQVMGEGWRMPTTKEFRELYINTDYKWTTINGINGGKFTSKTNSNAYVFFPAAGQLQGNNIFQRKGSYSLVWSSNPGSSDNAYYFYANSSEAFFYYTNYRNCGLSVRGVHAAV